MRRQTQKINHAIRPDANQLAALIKIICGKLSILLFACFFNQGQEDIVFRRVRLFRILVPLFICY